MVSAARLLPRVGGRGRFEELHHGRGVDGRHRCDVYFALAAPAGKEANWITTASGKPWFALFRFYGPEKPLFAKTWKLPDIEEAP